MRTLGSTKVQESTFGRRLCRRAKPEGHGWPESIPLSPPGIQKGSEWTPSCFCKDAREVPSSTVGQVSESSSFEFFNVF